MRIGTYNVYKFDGYPKEIADQSLGGPESTERIDHFVRVFEELDCDVLALQEGGVSPGMMQELAKRLGRDLVTVPSPLRWPGQILTRYPVLESRTFSHFSHREPVPPLSRCAGAARLHVDVDQRMWVFVLHLHPTDKALREREAAIIDERVRELLREESSMVVLGDFNCDTSEVIHELLAKQGFVNAMERAGGGLKPTIDTAGKSKKHFIDHIYVSPALVDRLTRAWVVNSKGFRHDEPREPGQWDHSDHLPVVCELDWP